MASPYRLKTVLPDDVLRVHSCTSREGLSDVGVTTLTLLSERKDILATELLGKLATLTIALREDAPRHLSGYVTRFAQRGFEGKHCVYEMQLKPWLWLLSRTSDCRIFQAMSVPEIVNQVFEDHPVARYEFRLMRPYRTWNYCVQYRETDFNFIARLLEHEGIYWYVEHDESGHKVVLCDSTTGHDAKPGCESLPFYGSESQGAPQLEYVQSWSGAQCVQPGKVVITDYDFEKPSSALETSRSVKRDYDLSEGEIFDYPGGYTKAGDGSQYVEDRLDELQSSQEMYDGTTNAQGVQTGHLLSLTRHPRDSENAQYLVTSTHLSLHQAANESGSGATSLRCSFTCIPAQQQFRPARRTPKPVVSGPQTAIVTGPAGEEIHTDKFGRVKVQFHWDRRGKRDERSSCWVSVAHPWAGSNFGGIHIPRIGQEVIVGFIEGDPDAPIIIGRTYNGENLPPWDLPANATQSGFLTRSTKGGSYGNANAIRFEDKQGAEQLWIHAEKNQDIEVENDETHWVGRDRTKTIDRHETTLVKGDRTETVNLDETITIHQNRTERVDLDEKISIGMNRTEDVGVNETINIGSNRSVTIGGNKTETVSMAKAETIGLAKALTIGLGYQTSVGAAMNTTVGGLQTEQVGLFKQVSVLGGDYTVSVSSGGYALTAAKEINITVGKASLVMKADGAITINGHTFSVGTSDAQNFNADGDITVKGKTIYDN
ncbi:type VI secretion system Vgr family protein [Roseateles depolymerans]|uniref:VgrG protein n=1 Tax=Roseateles depolymerans TaxID=76731 RepID=A0A0U3LFX0_9BURK|nr:type VI secretion system tip protein TssI/VgrG [Roseateles depolymerans]ALV05362.1 VgrG protein [Roseateles depolymerans]REG14622.1 type VI secretion system secreted protein VgrG [Roseateles depolymerans]